MTRPRISRDFIQANQKRRLIDGAARCFVAKGYSATTVADIVKETGVARNTFYDNFGSKEEVARAVIASVGSALDVELLTGSMFVLALDIASRLKLDDSADAARVVADAQALLDSAPDVDPLEPDADSPELSKLPPGRHGLPRDFVEQNQLTRLLAGTASAVYEKGFEEATIADITRHAAVSRRTFYEHFDGKATAVGALIGHSRITVPESDSNGLAYLWVEILAAAFCGNQVAAESKRRQGQAVVGLLEAQLNQAVAA